MKRRLIIATILLLLLAGWCLIPAPRPLLEGVEFSQRVFDRKGRLLRIALTPDEKYRVHTPLEKIAPELIAATLLHEDQHFRNHPGINPVASLRSAWRFVRNRHARGGASTITMQLARMRSGLQTRTVSGKLRQMFRALQIERHHSKDEILEAYLNLAPYGRNIEGIGAASLLCFGKPAEMLSLHEAVALSVVPQSPTRRALRSRAENQALSAAKAQLYARLRERWPHADPMGHEFDPRANAERAVAAPHFTRLALRESRAKRDQPNPVILSEAEGSPSEASASGITTTLDLDLQCLIERRITCFVETNRRLDVTNAAALLIDCRTMEVLAHAGSADFFDAKICGQVDGTRARRSPGSTLKPFIYALAIDQGLIHPLAIVKDTPQRFGGYNPENFDGEFAGPITASDSLIRSRNVPAVALAAQLTRPTLYDFLKRGGVALPREESHYGLALPLGGGEVTMEELVRLYAALANGGRLRPLRRTLEEKPSGAGARLLSPEAAFLTLKMLARTPSPGAGDVPVAWKTGTSHGFRDAWSVAVLDRYVLAVWVGHFDGRRNPAFIGRTCAAPLLFQIIDALRAEGRVSSARRSPPPGANLREVEFCAVSGQFPTAACRHRTSGWMIPGVSPIAGCEIHREVLVEVESGMRVPTDDGTRALRREVHEFWPSDLQALFATAGLPRRQPPPFLPESGASAMDALALHGKPPQIVSPQHGRAYALEDGTRRSIPLRAQTDADATKLYWFADRVFLGATSARETLAWKATPGAYKITALDDHGRAAVSAVTVLSAQGR